MKGIAHQFMSRQGVVDELEACQLAVEKYFGSRRALPADPTRLAASRGIAVEQKRNTPFEGMIERDCFGAARIVVKDCLNSLCSRFTVAHELGHWVLQEEILGQTGGKLFRGLAASSGEVAEEERLANLVAAEILMPCEDLTNVYRRHRAKSFLSVICDAFRVSRMAAIRRLADVSGSNFVLLQLVPYQFRDVGSAAEIDDAVYASARRSTLFDRDHTRLNWRLPFRMLVGVREVDLELRTPKGSLNGRFQLESRSSPIPTVYAVCEFEKWPSESAA